MKLEPMKTISVVTYRSAVTGRYVSKAYAQQNKSTTIRQLVEKRIRTR